jgi:hypothetical protein
MKLIMVTGHSITQQDINRARLDLGKQKEYEDNLFRHRKLFAVLNYWTRFFGFQGMLLSTNSYFLIKRHDLYLRKRGYLRSIDIEKFWASVSVFVALDFLVSKALPSPIGYGCNMVTRAFNTYAQIEHIHTLFSASERNNLVMLLNSVLAILDVASFYNMVRDISVPINVIAKFHSAMLPGLTSVTTEASIFMFCSTTLVCSAYYILMNLIDNTLEGNYVSYGDVSSHISASVFRSRGAAIENISANTTFLSSISAVAGAAAAFAPAA